MCATTDRLTAELLRILESETFRDPLLDDVRSGRMSRAGLRLWSLQASLVVREFTRFISAIHSNCPYRDAQRLLAENLWEEHGRGSPVRDHLFLVRRLAHCLGATDEDLDQAEPFPETAAYIDYCFRVSKERSFVEAIAAIGVGIEYYIPRFFGALGRALSARYELTERDVEYLAVHVSEDEGHARRSLEMIDRYADSPDLREKAKQALSEMLAVKRRFAEAVYAKCVIER